MTKKPKKRKMDPKLLSAQQHEIAYMAKKLGVSLAMVRLAHKFVGRSRIKVTAFITGYTTFEDA